MSSTLYIRKIPKISCNEYVFKYPLKGYIARKFYEHDGSLSGEMITIGSEYLQWFEGLLAAYTEEDKDKLEEIVEILRNGDTIDIWIFH